MKSQFAYKNNRSVTPWVYKIMNKIHHSPHL